jgi:hypothetical protein
MNDEVTTPEAELLDDTVCPENKWAFIKLCGESAKCVIGIGVRTVVSLVGLPFALAAIAIVAICCLAILALIGLIVAFLGVILLLVLALATVFAVGVAVLFAIFWTLTGRSEIEID